MLEPTSVLRGLFLYLFFLNNQKPQPELEITFISLLARSGLGMISLETPETVDSDPEIIAQDEIVRQLST
ncbi:MAG: hypothetical protein U5K71_12790 [Gracilimonas sp.]|nr:hypothetical protein [Gracilimonas sp.]